MIYLSAFVALALLFVLTASYVCYRMTFYSPKKRKVLSVSEIPGGEKIAKYKEQINELKENISNAEYEPVSIKSFDGLVLRGNYYEVDKNAALEIIFHGYKSTKYNDGSGGYAIGIGLGVNILLVDQRAQGESEGSSITFGINERYDCLSWIDYAVKRFGRDKKIIISGLSMGASTVLMASSLDLPPNVVGIIADCPYSSPVKIIKKVCTEDKHIPGGLAIPFIRFGGFLFGHFDLYSSSAEEAVKSCKIPVLLIHGDSDDFVPVEMCRDIYNNCRSDKKLVVFNNAGHGVSYFTDTEKYISEVSLFIQKVTEK